MNIRETLYNRMKNDAELNILVNAIYPGIAPKSAGNNIITYNRIGEKSINNLIGITLYQVSVWYKDLTIGDKIKERLIQLLDKWKSSEEGIEYCFVESVDDLYYPEQEEHGTHLTLRIKTFK